MPEDLILFTHPKPFGPKTTPVQVTAFRSWKKAFPHARILLFGKEPGTESLCADLGLEPAGEVKTEPASGAAIVSEMFQRVANRQDRLCMFLNSDIILGKEAGKVADQLAALRGPWLASGRRYCLPPFEEKFSVGQFFPEGFWASAPRWGHKTALDYFLWRGIDFSEMPEFIIGRCAWDNWMIWNARQNGFPVFDLSRELAAFHCDHDYAYSRGNVGVVERAGPLERKNLELLGNEAKRFHLGHATAELREGKLVPRRGWALRQRNLELWQLRHTGQRWWWLPLRRLCTPLIRYWETRTSHEEDWDVSRSTESCPPFPPPDLPSGPKRTGHLSDPAGFPPMAPVFSVVVVTYRRPRELEMVLKSMAQQEGAPPFELILVDNDQLGSAAPVAAPLVSSNPGWRYEVMPANNVSLARNRGAELAQAGWLAFLDDDCIPSLRWMSQAKDELTNLPETGVVFGGGYVQEFDRAGNPPQLPDQNFTKDQYLVEGNLFFRRSEYLALGGMRADLGPSQRRFGYHEGSELQNRHLECFGPHHRRVLIPRLAVRHLKANRRPEKLLAFLSGFDAVRAFPKAKQRPLRDTFLQPFKIIPPILRILVSPVDRKDGGIGRLLDRELYRLGEILGETTVNVRQFRRKLRG